MRIISRGAIVVHDLFMIAVAWELAWLARFNFSFPGLNFNYWQVNLKALPFVLLAQGIIAWRCGLYRGLWRFASVPDLWNIIRATVLGTLCIALALFVMNRLEYVPRSLFIIYPLFQIFLLGGPRLTYRLWKDRSLSFKTISGAQRVLILGSGRAGETVVRDMLRDGEFIPVGLLDNRRELTNMRIHGVPVLGMIDALVDIVVEHEVDMIFIAIPSATNAQMQRIVELCEKTGKPFRTLPRLQHMVSDELGLRELREVSIDDLLGRDKVELDWKITRQGLPAKMVMVSGGGGSIGAELCRQVACLAPAALVIFDRSEHNLYEVERSLLRQHPELEIHAILGDVCDPVAVDKVLARFSPDMIFHAAAYKHVPMLEFQSREAVRNNILGTRVLAKAAKRHGVRKFVMISTDKAVNPTSILGASKRIAEKLCESMNERAKTQFMIVRFGNVLDSAGSVVPLFRDQILRGGPVTVTHKDMTRYFMTIPEACQLILQAGAMGHGGEIFVLDMGEPVKIAYLAEQMIKLSGQVPGRDIRIVYTGLRPGEKLHEELFHKNENLEGTAHESILLARHRAEDPVRLDKHLDALETACEEFDEESIDMCLQQLIPELQRHRKSTARVVALNPHGRREA